MKTTPIAYDFMVASNACDFHAGWLVSNLCDIMAVGSVCDSSWCLATHLIFMRAGNACDFSWPLATHMTVMVVGNVYDFMVAGDAYDFHGG